MSAKLKGSSSYGEMFEGLCAREYDREKARRQAERFMERCMDAVGQRALAGDVDAVHWMADALKYDRGPVPDSLDTVEVPIAGHA